MKEIGYFNDDNFEYIIKDMYPIRPLLNYIWNERVICGLNQFGFGESKVCLDKNFRALVQGERVVYIKDKDNNQVFDINRNFNALPFKKHFCNVGIGYQEIVSQYDDVESSLTITVDDKELAELYKVTLKNVSKQNKRLYIYPFIKPLVNFKPNLAYTRASFDEQRNSICFSYDAFQYQNKYPFVFFSSSVSPESYALSTDDFVGVYNLMSNPKGVTADKLASRSSIFDENYCCAFQLDVELLPNQEKTFYFVLANAKNKQDYIRIHNQLLEKNYFESLIEKQRNNIINYRNSFVLSSPDAYLNSMINVWLKRQIELGKTWGRVYAKGFRDLMQDITAFAGFDIKTARMKILYTLSLQFENGNAIRQVDPVLNHPYQDMPVWIPMAILSYLNESGDFSILDEQVKYYESDLSESVFMHLKRGIDYLLENQGEHHLSLWGGGDWNDSINAAGLNFKGESVWLSIATVKAINDYIEILSMLSGDYKNEISLMIEKRDILKENIIKFGFDKDHFIYGINDWGEYVGAYSSEEAKIFLNPQTWAVMSGILDNDSLNKLMDVVEQKLKCDYGYMQNQPAYSKCDEHIGRVTSMVEGVYENASVYNHGVLFKVVADCLLKRSDLAYNTLKMIRYDNPKNSQSGVEPYVLSNMYFGPEAPCKKGFAPLSWITGTAGWYYRVVVENILGIMPTINGLKIDPCMPSDWDKVNCQRSFRGAVYDITLQKGEEKSLVVDGKKIEGNIIPIFSDNKTHKVTFIF